MSSSDLELTSVDKFSSSGICISTRRMWCLGKRIFISEHN